MSDIITNTSTLLIESSFIDGDTRTLTLKNPSSSISTNAIQEFNTFLQSSNILVGDRSSADFNKILQVRRRNARVIKLDISQT